MAEDGAGWLGHAVSPESSIYRGSGSGMRLCCIHFRGVLLNAGTDIYNLERFLNAQESTFDVVQSELAAGRKRTHWMWFVFPQIKGLGSSPTAQRFAISNLEEAAAYLEHPVLMDGYADARRRVCRAARPHPLEADRHTAPRRDPNPLRLAALLLHQRLAQALRKVGDSCLGHCLVEMLAEGSYP